jgi:hypothetical protein
MPWTQPSTNSAFVHHPEARIHTNSSFGVINLAGISRPTTSAEGINGGAIMVPLSSPDDPLTTYPTVWTVPGPMFANGDGFTSGDSQRIMSQDGSHMEKKATTEVYEEFPQHATSGVLANKPSHELTSQWRGPVLPVDSQGGLSRIKDDMVKNGADVEAVNVCDEIFKVGFNKEELQRRLTREQCRRLRLRDGKQYQRLLEEVRVGGETKNRWGLCPGNDAALYKKHRDALRHFLKDHFGLGFECTHW